MWCRNCKQDVPGVRGESFESIRCARCQQELASGRSSKSRLSQTPSSISFAEWQHGNLPDLLQSKLESARDSGHGDPAKEDDHHGGDESHADFAANSVDDTDLKEFDAEIRRIDRIINLWGEPRYLRFDSAHNGPHAKSGKEEKRKEKPDKNHTQATDPQGDNRPNLLAVCLTFGGLLAIVLGAVHAISTGEPKLSRDTSMVAGFVSAGALGIIAGLWYEIGRLKRKVSELRGGNSDEKNS